MPHLQSLGDGNYTMRWRETRLTPDGSTTTVHASKSLGKFPTKRDAKAALAEASATITKVPTSPQATMPVATFIEHCFLPAAATRLRASTSYGYRQLFKEHRRFLPDVALRDFRTVHGEQLLVQIQAAKGMSKNSLHNIKSWMSGVFKYACRIGVLDHNPIRDISLPRAKEADETYAYTLEEVADMLQRVPGRAAAVIAVAGYSGLRRGEIGCLKWEDYHDGAIYVQRAQWNGIIDAPKTARSKAPVPVIRQLQEVLTDWRFTLDVQGKLNEWMFCEQLDMEAVEDQEIRPHYPQWHGWHPARRGLATSLKRLGTEDVVIQAILRHASVSTTQRHYVKVLRPDVVAAMDRLSERIEEAG